ncbi:amidohydrolase family protein [Bizionia gelidisalsuginis]|uniref:Amidohydrolase family protein n=1 Tax=Bizionia gelidisalsuginis TaxID=291188 RepID=A0ABY3MBD4_9FLAO|nr:amidohydrolase family protein [Bizionia gelidisalsuginis]TYC14118.1 amidohydrolase family protein [Bizionia gelidisalsuginis]
MLDLLIKNARIEGYETPVSIGVTNGIITCIEAIINSDAEIIYDANDHFVCSGFYESHIHLDKACILERCTIAEGTLAEAVSETGNAKKEFTEEDVFERARRVVEMAIKKGTMGLRTFVETDPKTELRAFEAIKRVRKRYAFAIDMEICAFAQEGLTTEKQTQRLLRKALQNGADLVGGCPYKDENPYEHIEIIFDLAEEFDVNVDFHLDFDLDPNNSSIPKIAEETKNRNYEGRVSIGHVTKLSAMPRTQRLEMAMLLKEADIALTVLPATDVFLNGRDYESLIPRGMVNANALSEKGITTTISSNNILNAFTPYGDASLVRMANMYANIAQLSKDSAIQEVYNMITKNAAKLLSKQTEIKLGSPANFVVLEAVTAIDVIRTIAQPLAGFKNGIQTFSNTQATINFP